MLDPDVGPTATTTTTTATAAAAESTAATSESTATAASESSGASAPSGGKIHVPRGTAARLPPRALRSNLFGRLASVECSLIGPGGLTRLRSLFGFCRARSGGELRRAVGECFFRRYRAARGCCATCR